MNTLDFGARLDVFARSHASASKVQVPENQDNFVVVDGHGRAIFLYEQREEACQLSGWPAGHVRLAVLDGMGGHGHGRQAAEAAAAGLLSMPACQTLEQLSERMDALHDSLQDHFSLGDDGDARRPGTMLTMLELRPGLAPLLYHVGDTRLYEITPERLQPLTVDHVPATAFAMQGMVGEQEWWQQVHGEHRAQISQAFILGNAISDPQYLTGPLHALNDANLPYFLQGMGDRRALTVREDALYLLASDGFWACAQPIDWVGQWPALLGGKTAAEAIAALFDSFIETPPPQLHFDNLTAVAVRFKSAENKLNMIETASA
ncbi:MAG: protein phosphatase [Pseudomonadota bacterium]